MNTTSGHAGVPSVNRAFVLQSLKEVRCFSFLFLLFVPC